MRNRLAKRVFSEFWLGLGGYGLISCLFLLLVLLMGFSTKALADGFVGTSRIFYTLNPSFGSNDSNFSSSQVEENPMYLFDSQTGDVDFGSKSDYVTDIFRMILQVCHQEMAKLGTLDQSDTGYYWAQVLGCLAVPYHESRLTHFRRVLPLANEDGESICSLRMNNGQFLSSNKKLYEIYQTLFKAKGVIKECSNYNLDSSYIQLVGSGDAYSTGIMQVAMNWHPAHVANGDHLQVEATLRYGLNKYLTAMKRLRLGYKKHSCLVRGNGIDYFNLVRSAWSGDYNSGADVKACRYSNPKDAWAANDNNFLADLKGILDGQRDLFPEALVDPEDLKVLKIISESGSQYLKKSIDAQQLEGFRQELKKYITELLGDGN